MFSKCSNNLYYLLHYDYRIGIDLSVYYLYKPDTNILGRVGAIMVIVLAGHVIVLV